ncbi:hypothetical protein [Rhodococcus pyridinivorans]
MSDPQTPEGRADLRQFLADGRNAEWSLCEDGRTVAEDASEDEAKWIADAGPCTADLIVAAVNALPALLDALDDAEFEIERQRGDLVIERRRAEAAEATLDRVRELSEEGKCWGGADAIEEFIRRLDEILDGTS